MSDLPPGWEWVTLQDLASAEPRAITDGPFGSHLKSSHYTTAGARVIRLQNIGDGEFIDEEAYISLAHFEELRAHEAREGDLVIASLGENPPRACLIPPLTTPAIVKADCIRVRLHPEVNAKWVLYALLAPPTKNYLVTRIRGVGRPRLGLREIRRIPLPLPSPADQRRIVTALEGFLSQLDQGEKLLLDVLYRTSRFHDGLVAAACTGRFSESTSNRRTTVLESAGVVDGELPRIPGHWRWARLGEIAELVGGITKDTKHQGAPGLEEVPYLRVANVQRGWLDLSEVSTIKVSPQKARQLELQPGDVLLNEGGDRDKLGRGWVWEGQIPRCIHQNHVFRARIIDGILNPMLLAWHANTFGRRWFEMNGKQTVNLASISLSKIKLLPVPIPPREEQDHLVEAVETRLAVMRKGEQAIRQARSRAQLLRQSLLSDAFTGRLIAQHPNDEPASENLTEMEIERSVKADPSRRTGPHDAKWPLAHQETLL
jgi:type I restriction enzyme S subunit